ncbi:hypothetical protein EYV94_21565 [Puteibacter caeruleilacunae]|nr:hypothetical protein EYV94_21565 [Puteibacter caeruleilacunae]
MKNLGNFLLGSISTFGLHGGIQHLDAASSVPTNLVDSIEALISLVGGIVSTVVVAWLKGRWNRKNKKLEDSKE